MRLKTGRRPTAQLTVGRVARQQHWSLVRLWPCDNNSCTVNVGFIQHCFSLTTPKMCSSIPKKDRYHSLSRILLFYTFLSFWRLQYIVNWIPTTPKSCPNPYDQRSLTVIMRHVTQPACWSQPAMSPNTWNDWSHPGNNNGKAITMTTLCTAQAKKFQYRLSIQLLQSNFAPTWWLNTPWAGLSHPPTKSRWNMMKPPCAHTCPVEYVMISGSTAIQPTVRDRSLFCWLDVSCYPKNDAENAQNLGTIILESEFSRF